MFKECLLISDIELNPSKLPKSSWKEIQSACPVLSKAFAFLKAGKLAPKKEKNQRDLRRYLAIAQISPQGILVVPKQIPFCSKPSLLKIVPRHFATNLARIVHDSLDHPAPSQLRKQLEREYFMLNIVQITEKVTEECTFPCQAKKTVPRELVSYKTEIVPLSPGTIANYDILKEKIEKNSKKENDSGLVNFDKKRFGISEKNKVKTLENPNGRGAQNTDKEFKKSMGEKKKFSKEMGGTKSWRSKSSWKGAGKLDSTRKAWRPDRAYDFGRNHMEINDVETPNDNFELARIV